jgi:hypothetical protein
MWLLSMETVFYCEIIAILQQKHVFSLKNCYSDTRMCILNLGNNLVLLIVAILK